MAESLLGEFLSLHPDGIRRLREIAPSFKDFSRDLICSTCDGTPPVLAAELCVREGQRMNFLQRQTRFEADVYKKSQVAPAAWGAGGLRLGSPWPGPSS
jgi:hypothetical protein